MCSICGFNTCIDTCINHYDKPVGKCDNCNVTIYEGDRIYRHGDKTYCDCLKDMCPSEFIELFGLQTEIARSENDY